ncbi:MAG: hypothetical protein D6734_09715 [Candidatus Schekmanbacteria bacterium]|nr:MAG: hypothetical protein D6734_09715 [Candidatus Schekmanbacteria bacterium]
MVILPFENIGGQQVGWDFILDKIKSVLVEKGYAVISGDEIEPYLLEDRIRDTSNVSQEFISKIGKLTGAAYVLVGMIDIVVVSEENPQFGLSARVLSAEDSSILWADYLGSTGDSTKMILGLGNIKSLKKLITKVVKKVFASIPSAGKAFLRRSFLHRLSFARFFPNVDYYYSSDFLKKVKNFKIAVLPFENLSERRGAGKVLRDIFLVSLFKYSTFEVIDSGRVKNAIVKYKVWPYGGVDIEGLQKVKAALDADAVIVGVVEDYNEGLRKRGVTSSPEISVYARMIDTKDGKIIWTSEDSAKGEDTQIVLDFGVIKSAVELAKHITRKMVFSMR